MRTIFGVLLDVLGEEYWVGPAGNPGDGLAEMYYGQIDHISEKQLPAVFKTPQSPCRCIVATLAFGLGMEIPDVEYVLHWGPASSHLQYWQEIGRAGRGWPQSSWYYVPATQIP